MYFNDDDSGKILARDILIYDSEAEEWAWIDYSGATPTLAYVSGWRPTTILDAFSNDAFWCDDCDTAPASCTSGRACSGDSPTWEYKDPVIISTEDDSGGTDFTLTSPFNITSTTSATALDMSFNIANTLTAWASEAQIDSVDTTKIDISQSCGFHPFFPAVTITSE